MRERLIIQGVVRCWMRAPHAVSSDSVGVDPGPEMAPPWPGIPSSWSSAERCVLMVAECAVAPGGQVIWTTIGQRVTIPVPADRASCFRALYMIKESASHLRAGSSSSPTSWTTRWR